MDKDKIRFFNLLGLELPTSIEELEYAYSEFVNNSKLAYTKVKNMDIRRKIVKNLLFSEKMIEIITNEMLIKAESEELDVFVKILNNKNGKTTYDIPFNNREISSENLIPPFMSEKNNTDSSQIKEGQEDLKQEDKLEETTIPEFVKKKTIIEDHVIIPDKEQEKKKQNIFPKNDLNKEAEKTIVDKENENKEEVIYTNPEIKYDENENLTSHIIYNSHRKKYINGNFFTETKKMIEDNIGLIIGITVGTIIIGSIYTMSKNSKYTEPIEYNDSTPETIEATIEPEITKPTEENNNYNDNYVLINKHIVQPNETLLDYSIKSNTKLEKIINMNEYVIFNDNKINVGNTINIPYYINGRDLKYYSEVLKYDFNRNIDDYLIEYETTIETLKSLNPNAIIETNGYYAFIADKIRVPKFISYENYKEQKGNDAMKKILK